MHNTAFFIYDFKMHINIYFIIKINNIIAIFIFFMIFAIFLFNIIKILIVNTI